LKIVRQGKIQFQPDVMRAFDENLMQADSRQVLFHVIRAVIIQTRLGSGVIGCAESHMIDPVAAFCLRQGTIDDMNRRVLAAIDPADRKIEIRRRTGREIQRINKELRRAFDIRRQNREMVQSTDCHPVSSP